MNIGENIKIFRKVKNLTQKQLAEKCGLSRVAIGNYERGCRIPNIEAICKISKALDVDINTLITEIELI